ncbi:MAG: diaminopimelate epimerase [Alphaproteobacteria bacterium]|nr:diaminopimelate epimerase [Alphaproteobacteria bacterium]
MRSFLKMNGLGNDFVIFDCRSDSQDLTLSESQIRFIADRRLGVGCDQLIILHAAPAGAAIDAVMRIFNSDGSEVQTCGNATRCVGKLIFAEKSAEEVVLETLGGRLRLRRAANGLVAADLGRVRLDWAEIPLAEPRDSLHIPDFKTYGIGEGVATNVGNPHITFFVPTLDGVAITEIGPLIETHPLFAQRVNVGFAEMLGRHSLRLRVWERGAGLTRACGSGATAAWIAAIRRGLGAGQGRVQLDGGELAIDWQDDGHAIMTGGASTSFSGVLADLPA